VSGDEVNEDGIREPVENRCIHCGSLIIKGVVEEAKESLARGA
jgi:hypothetical protein